MKQCATIFCNVEDIDGDNKEFVLNQESHHES